MLQSMRLQRVKHNLVTEQQGILQEDQALGSKHTGVNALSEARMHTRRLCSLKEPRGHSLQDCPEVGEGANITKFSGVSVLCASENQDLDAEVSPSSGSLKDQCKTP